MKVKICFKHPASLSTWHMLHMLRLERFGTVACEESSIHLSRQPLHTFHRLAGAHQPSLRVCQPRHAPSRLSLCPIAPFRCGRHPRGKGSPRRCGEEMDATSAPTLMPRLLPPAFRLPSADDSWCLVAVAMAVRVRGGQPLDSDVGSVRWWPQQVGDTPWGDGESRRMDELHKSAARLRANPSMSASMTRRYTWAARCCQKRNRPILGPFKRLGKRSMPSRLLFPSPYEKGRRQHRRSPEEMG